MDDSSRMDQLRSLFTRFVEVVSPYEALLWALFSFVVVLCLLIFSLVRKDPSDPLPGFGNVKRFWKYTDLFYYCVGGVAVFLAAYGFLYDQWATRISEIERTTDDTLIRLVTDMTAVKNDCELKNIAKERCKDRFVVHGPECVSEELAYDNGLSCEAADKIGTILAALQKQKADTGKYGGPFLAVDWSVKDETVKVIQSFRLRYSTFEIGIFQDSTRWVQLIDYTDIWGNLTGPDWLPKHGLPGVSPEFVASRLEFLDQQRKDWESLTVRTALGALPNFLRGLWPVALGFAFALRIGRVMHELRYLKASAKGPNETEETTEEADLRKIAESAAITAVKSAIATREEEAKKVTATRDAENAVAEAPSPTQKDQAADQGYEEVADNMPKNENS